MQSKEQVTKRIWERTFLNFSKAKCEITGKFKGKCPLGVLIYISVDLRKGQGRAKDMGTISLYLVVKIMIEGHNHTGGIC